MFNVKEFVLFLVPISWQDQMNENLMTLNLIFSVDLEHAFATFALWHER